MNVVDYKYFITMYIIIVFANGGYWLDARTEMK